MLAQRLIIELTDTHMEDYDPAFYDAFEARVASEIEQDESTIGEFDENLQLDFCADCPLINFPVQDAVRTGRGVGASADKPGLEVTIQFESPQGEWSKRIVLGRHHSNSIGSKRQSKIYADAAEKTQKCQGPKRVPKLLGPLAMKRCGALKESR